MQLKCIKCDSDLIIKNGNVFGTQRYKCKNCGYQFTKMASAGKPLFIKLMCHGLYVSGLSMREIARITGVTAQSISRWIRKWQPVYMEDIGRQSTIYTATKDNLTDYLNLKADEELLIASTELPSGAKYNVVIQLPANFSKH